MTPDEIKEKIEEMAIYYGPPTEGFLDGARWAWNEALDAAIELYKYHGDITITELRELMISEKDSLTQP